jgi:hypothetical protein
MLDKSRPRLFFRDHLQELYLPGSAPDAAHQVRSAGIDCCVERFGPGQGLTATWVCCAHRNEPDQLRKSAVRRYFLRELCSPHEQRFGAASELPQQHAAQHVPNGKRRIKPPGKHQHRTPRCYAERRSLSRNEADAVHDQFTRGCERAHHPIVASAPRSTEDDNCIGVGIGQCTFEVSLRIVVCHLTAIVRNAVADASHCSMDDPVRTGACPRELQPRDANRQGFHSVRIAKRRLRGDDPAPGLQSSSACGQITTGPQDAVARCDRHHRLNASAPSAHGVDRQHRVVLRPECPSHLNPSCGGNRYRCIRTGIGGELGFDRPAIPQGDGGRRDAQLDVDVLREYAAKRCHGLHILCSDGPYSGSHPRHRLLEGGELLYLCSSSDG